MNEFKLEDLAGIGPTKAKRLENSGIKSPMDFVIRGAKEVSRITDISVPASLKLVHEVKELLAEGGLPILINSLGTLRELKKIQKNLQILYMATVAPHIEQIIILQMFIGFIFNHY